MDDPAHAPTAQGAAAQGGELAHTATQVGGAARELSAQAGLARGELLAHYRVERMLGAGGMGQVYLAEDLGLMRQVAVKVLAPHLLDRGPVHMARMMREARTQASVNHPNLCHVYYVGQQAAQVFVAMEYVRGRTFAQLGRLTPPVALRLVRQAAQGLAAMADAGVVHRDIKPSNLMLDDTGLVKVLERIS